MVFFLLAFLGSVRAATDGIDAWNNHLNSVTAEGSGLYYEFDSAESEVVWSGQVEGRPGSWAYPTTAFPLASVSKLYTGLAAMYTMQLKPREFYPEKFINEFNFNGWDNFKDFPVHGGGKANLTIHQLLTHTSGLPFGLKDSKSDVQHMTLFYKPGTKFGYTLGHRVIGWFLRDFWKQQPETKDVKINSVNDCYRWLIFNKLGLSESTKFSVALNGVFGSEGEAGDASIQSTGEDFMKLAVLALRRGKLPSGEQMISEANWNKWAVPNLLPGGKLTKDLVDWQGGAADWYDMNVGGVKEAIMKQAGDYGWSYFGSTWYDSREIGWCGFFSSCLRVSYPQDAAFVMMQRDIADVKKSKPYLRANFDAMAKSLHCTKKTCEATQLSTLYCEKCTMNDDYVPSNCKDVLWTDSCPQRSVQGKVQANLLRDTLQKSCYVPHCQNINAGSDATGVTCGMFSRCSDDLGPTECVNGACVCKAGTHFEDGWCAPSTTCRKMTGGTCQVLGCDASRGPAECVNSKCVCQDGYCEAGGQCNVDPVNAACPQLSAGTCKVFGCHSNRGPTNCLDGLCLCKPGYCSLYGVCMPGPFSNPGMMGLLGTNASVEKTPLVADAPQIDVSAISAVAGCALVFSVAFRVAWSKLRRPVVAADTYQRLIA